MSETPRTDAATCRYTGGEPVTFPQGLNTVVPLDFARTLERELAEAREENKKLKNALHDLQIKLDVLQAQNIEVMKRNSQMAICLIDAELAKEGLHNP